jgi:hypothetical protein
MFAGGDGSTLSLDFTTMSGLDSRFTFTRASIGTYIDSAGLVKQKEADTFYTNGFEAARFDHDPTTLAPRGLLLEGSATNLLTDSEDYSGWASGATTVSDETGALAPDGVSTPDRISDNSSNAEHNRARTVSTSTVTTYTASAWFKNPATNGRQYAGFQMFAGGGTDTGGVLALWDFNTGVQSSTLGYGGKATPSSVAATQYPNGWWKVSLSLTVTGTLTAVNLRLVLSNNGSTTTTYANSGTALGILAWGAQLEAGSGASSYIPTGAGTVQRAADVCNMTGTNFSSWFVDGSPYSMLFKYSMNNPSAWAGTNVDRGVGLLSNNLNNPRVFINAAYRVASGSGDIGRFIRVFDSGTLDMAPGTYPAAASNVALAFAVNTNDSAVYGSNQIIGTDSSNTLLTGYNQFAIGRTGGATQHINGCVSLIKYWPQRLPNATLQGLVA